MKLKHGDKEKIGEVLKAPEMDVITIRQLGAGGGYATFPKLSEF